MTFLLLATNEVKDNVLSGYKRKDRDNEADSNKGNEARSSREIVWEKINGGNNNTKYQSFGFTDIDVGEERPEKLGYWLHEAE